MPLQVQIGESALLGQRFLNIVFTEGVLSLCGERADGVGGLRLRNGEQRRGMARSLLGSVYTTANFEVIHCQESDANGLRGLEFIALYCVASTSGLCALRFSKGIFDGYCRTTGIFGQQTGV